MDSNSNNGNGYFDLQVNGYAGIDFNQDDLAGDDLHLVCERLAWEGVDGILATIVTEHVDKMERRLRNLVTLRERDPLARQIIAGIHIEGPFLNETPGYRGAHPADAIHPADAGEMERLLDAAGGLACLVTLAPERDAGLKVTRMLAGRNITVAAGHCDPSLDELRAAIDAGLSVFTHLGNGCPMQMHRHDNIIQRALSLHDRLWLCFIADGAHVAFPALGNYLRAAGLDRCVVVTDAIAPASLGPGRYTLGRWDLVIGPDLVARAPDGSHLIGAVVTMPQCAANLVERVGLSRQDALRLTVTNPRRAIGLS
jgi:N-acetylglucosamine-6-phosphate deacetylase